MSRHSGIIASGSFAPERVLKNEWFNEKLGEDVDTWLRENLTIRERRWMTDGQTTSDLCVEAGNKALQMAELKPTDIDLLIIATDTPDFISPSTASVVQHKMALKNATSFDTNTACAGFPTAFTLANSLMMAEERYKKVMVMGAYGMSRFLNPDDKKTVTLFADGAGAVILDSIEEQGKGFLSSDMRTRGEYHGHMGIYTGAAADPITEQKVSDKMQCLRFVEKFPKELNPKIWSDMIRTVCKRAEAEVSDVKHVFITQININQIWETMEILGLPRETAPTIMDRYGYTGSAAIPMVFDETYRNNPPEPGDLAVFIGSGGGLHFGACAYRF